MYVAGVCLQDFEPSDDEEDMEDTEILATTSGGGSRKRKGGDADGGNATKSLRSKTGEHSRRAPRVEIEYEDEEEEGGVAVRERSRR